MLIIIRNFLFLFLFLFLSISYKSFSSEVLLTKTVTNITQATEASTSIEAVPGDVIEYNQYVLNDTKNVISNIQISASVPQFTVSAMVIDCNTSSLPSALSCQVMTPDGINRSGYQGLVTWKLLGNLNVGEIAKVSYQVIIK